MQAHDDIISEWASTNGKLTPVTNKHDVKNLEKSIKALRNKCLGNYI